MDNTWTTVALAFIAAMQVISLAWINRKQEDTHRLVNSQMNEFKSVLVDVDAARTVAKNGLSVREVGKEVEGKHK